MSERLNSTLLGPSMLRLFGRVLAKLTEAAQARLQAAKAATQAAEAADAELQATIAARKAYTGNSLLVQMLQREDLMVAHIFGFSHDGRYTPMHTPALFLVQGEGEPVMVEQQIDPARLGVAFLEAGSSFASDLRFWACDRADEAIRLDISAGKLQMLVIDAEAGHADGHGRRIDLVGQNGSYTHRLGRGSY